MMWKIRQKQNQCLSRRWKMRKEPRLLVLPIRWVTARCGGRQGQRDGRSGGMNPWWDSTQCGPWGQPASPNTLHPFEHGLLIRWAKPHSYPWFRRLKTGVPTYQQSSLWDYFDPNWGNETRGLRCGSREKDYFLPVSGQKTPVKRVLKDAKFSLEYLSHVTWLLTKKITLQFIFYKALKCFLSRLTVATAILQWDPDRWASCSRYTNRLKSTKAPKPAASRSWCSAQLTHNPLAVYIVSCFLPPFFFLNPQSPFQQMQKL